MMKVCRGLSALSLLSAATLSAAPLRVLVYSSFVGRESMGEYLEAAYSQECAECKVLFVPAPENINLLAWAKKSSQSPRPADFVLGLERQNFAAAEEQKLLGASFLFDQSPFVILLNKKLWGDRPLPNSWKDLPQSLGRELFVQDPRFSQVGVGWLRAIFENSLLSLGEAKKLQKRVFPSWSSAYSAFTRGGALAIWTFQTSEAYHRCTGKNSAEKEAYISLPLKEGYPVHEEWVAELKKSQAAPRDRQRFSKFLRSAQVQQSLYLKNWMFPGQAQIKAPPCYSEMNSGVRGLPTQNLILKDLQKWIDEWSL